MGGLSHYIEAAGVATTHISLIREHTVGMQPPRALWVPFELGRPFGVPDDPVFQTRVLKRVLELLEAPAGPVLADFPEDAPDAGSRSMPPACPVNFGEADTGSGTADAMLAAFRQEVIQLHNWYDLAVSRRGRTTADVTGLEPEEIAGFLADFVRGRCNTSPLAGIPLAAALRMAAEDLKAYYLEAASALPGQPADSTALADWFWQQTAAARVIRSVRDICLENPDAEFQLLGNLLLVPRRQL